MMNHTSASQLLAGLNPEQLTAITWPSQPALVLAGAGSGKTHVLTTRIAWLLQTGQADVLSIMAVTFTNKAAKEMQARIAARFPYPLRGMWLGTFHGLCHRFLRMHHKEAGLPADFQILDMSDQLSVVKRLLKSLNISEEVIPARTLQGFINAQKESGLRAAVLMPIPRQPNSRTMIECYAAYDDLCRREGLADFAELMLRSYEVLNANEMLCRHYQNRFRHILVDEFQDTNKLQYAWLKLLAGEHAAIFAVGDDDQSIYSFRGAYVGNMTALMREFHIDEPIRLEQNYRSVGNILAAANAVIAHNSERLGKNLRTDAENGERIRFYCAPSDSMEAEFIVSEIQATAKSGTPLSQIAILYRSNAQSRILEQALFHAQLPYKIYGGLRFYERQEIKHVLAYLRMVASPHNDDALLRIINVPARGIGAKSIENLQAAAEEQGVSLWQAACSSGTTGKVAVFVRLIEQFRQQAVNMPLPDLIQTIIEDSGLAAHYQKSKADGQDRLDNLGELVSAAAFFRPQDVDTEMLPEAVKNSPFLPIVAFLSAAALEAGEHQAGSGEDAVQLMTVHAAKGLEFDTVFVSGLEEGRFPSELSLQERGGLEEERRLMYVAVTRARKRLFLTMAAWRMIQGKTEFGTASRFIGEIPPDLLLSLSSAAPPKPFRQPEMPLRQTVQEEFVPLESFDGFYLGQNVRHEKFGTGVIIDAVSKGRHARLTINFGKQGIKELDTAFAKLEAV